MRRTRTLCACLCLLLLWPGAASAQHVRWVVRELRQSGPGEAATCAAARAAAQQAARAYQALNILTCRCDRADPKDRRLSGQVSCRLTYEVLVRTHDEP